MLITSLASTRSLLHVHGAEAAKFLQGLVTNDIIKQKQSQESTIQSDSQNDNGSSSHAVYAGFLSAQGRVLHDTFILPSTSTSSSTSIASDFLIDYPNNVTSPSLPSYIKRYILRSKVKSKSVDDQYRLWAIFNDPLQVRNSSDEQSSNFLRTEEELRSLAGENGGKWWRDRRSKSMGYRLLLPPEASKAIESSSFASSLPSFHTLLRTLTNVPEAPADLIPNSALPLESNMDIMGGIDFRKGCYIGQELTARTYHTGVIRKRMMPVRLYSAGSSERPPTSLLPESWTKIISVTPLSMPEETDIRPSSSSSSSTSTRRHRAAGKLSSVLRVTGSSLSSGKEEEVHLGLALLRLESADGELGTSCVGAAAVVEAEGTEQITATGHAGVNSSGGLQEPLQKQGETLQGEWMVKAFKESLEGAK